jgi:hypothetical protein
MSFKIATFGFAIDLYVCINLYYMSKRKYNKRRTNQSRRMDDVIRALRRGSREAEKELMGPGFHSKSYVHASKKTYTRKDKHKQSFDTTT